MKHVINKITAVIDFIYGWSIFTCLFVGGLMFFGFLSAFLIGGDTAAAICHFIYNKVFKVLIYGGNIAVLLGLISMYLKNQMSLTISDTTHEAG